MEFEGCLNGGKSMKAYLKPVLYYERFELSQHIASCDLKVTAVLGGGCNASGMAGGYLPVSQIFLNSDDACVNKLDSFEGYCYTNFTAIMGTHAS